MPPSFRLDRRRFLAASAATVAAASGLTSRGRPAPSERLTLGFIGIGIRGRNHLGAFLGRSEVQVLAVCEVVAERRNDARQRVEQHYGKAARGSYRGCHAYTDFRELLARKDIDAVVIATPDHWHAIPCIDAARAGKHVYSEKPLTHTIAEGRRIVNAVKAAGIVFQTGSQQRSTNAFGNVFLHAAELIRNGRLGKIKTVRVGVGEPAQPCDLPEQPVPSGTDWDFWLGPASQRGYNEILCPKGIHRHYPAWRKYKEYGGGGLADMGAHHFDIAQWALGTDRGGPVRIEPPARGNSGLRFIYANGVEMFHGGPSGCTFEGETGTIYVDRGVIRSKPESILKEPLTAKDVRLYHSADHRGNWLECIRAKRETICPAEIGQRSATVCHLGNIGYWLRRPLTWDPDKEHFTNNAEANKLVDRVPRAPWKY